MRERERGEREGRERYSGCHDDRAGASERGYRCEVALVAFEVIVLVVAAVSSDRGCQLAGELHHGWGVWMGVWQGGRVVRVDGRVAGRYGVTWPTVSTQ